jgi:hypothetical protein
VCRFHIAAGEKLHANKFPGTIVRSVVKLAGVNLRKFGSFSYWFDTLGFTTEGRLVDVLIITFSWGFQLGGYIYIYNSYINTAPPINQKMVPIDRLAIRGFLIRDLRTYAMVGIF